MSEFNPYEHDDPEHNTNNLTNDKQPNAHHNTSEHSHSDPNTDCQQDIFPSLFNENAKQKSSIYEWNFSDYERLNQDANMEKTKHSKGLVVLAFTLSILLVLVIMMFTIYVAYENNKISSIPHRQQTETANNGPNLTIKDPPAAAQDNTEATTTEMTTTEIASKVTPSVVGIQTYSRNSNYESTSQGSGIIISEDGYIVTSAHVLFDNNNNSIDIINVMLNNGAEHEADIVGIDIKTDLAVIKIDASGLLYAEFGNSDQVQLGDRVVAVGNSKTLDSMGSISQGIISGLHHSTNISSNITIGLIQTDANINIGNAGGALANVYGQVIGINTIILNGTNYDQNGIVIPFNDAQPIIDDLIKYGYVQNRIKTGFSFRMIDSSLSKASNVPKGLYITGMESNADASLNGLAIGDIVTKIDGKDVLSYQTLYDVLANKKAGQTLKLTIYRTSKINKSTPFEMDIVLAEDRSDFRNNTLNKTTSTPPFAFIP